MNESEHSKMSTEDNAVHSSQQRGFSSFVSRLDVLIKNFKPSIVIEQLKRIRTVMIESGIFSEWLFLLAMPMLAIVIQCGLFLFGKTCSPFPMWFSFLLFSLLALIIHWKCLIKFWTFVFLGLLFTAYTFSYFGTDAELCHVPMQLLLKGGWNPIFDSTIPKLRALVDPSTLFLYHTLFMPKCIALCGALVAQSTGLWIANSFLGYLLLFILFRTIFVFAEQNYKCNKTCSLLFATSISFCTQSWTLLDGLVDFHGYEALLVALFSLFLYLKNRNMHDFIMAVMATVLCCTTKLNGIANCIVLWFAFGVFSWKNKETYRGIEIIFLLVLLIGMSPIITSWIQYGSPLYPAATFDPKATTVDLTDDFFGNADGERLGVIARFVYGWISPEFVTKAAALFYHKPDFTPEFNLQVTRGVGGFGKFLNVLFFFSLVFILISKKNMLSFIYLYIVITLFLCPVKYFGYERYFPQAWIAIPLGIYQFCFFPPAWIKKKERTIRCLRIGLFVVLFLVSLSIITFFFAYQTRNMIMEGKRQTFLASLQRDGITFEIPHVFSKGYCLSQRLVCANVPYSFSEKSMDMRKYKYGKHKGIIIEDSIFPQFTQYYLDVWNATDEYNFSNNPSTLLRFKWLDVFKFFPHPLFCRELRVIESSVTPTDSDDIPSFRHGKP